jgi:dihydroorotate dehydrogenase (fumarate)
MIAFPLQSLITAPMAARADATFAGAPATVEGKIDPTRTKFDYQVSPGQKNSDQIYVGNLGTVPLEFEVFAAGASSGSDGTYAFDDGDVGASDIASWTKFSNGKNRISLTLKPKTHVALGFDVSVPPNAAPGDHAGGIIVQGKQKSDGGQIAIQGRVATRMYVRVQGDIKPSLTISSISTSYQGYVNPFDGDLTEKYTITNNGNIAMSARVTTAAKGLFELPLSAEHSWDIAEILPGSTRKIDVTIHGVGQWVLMNATVKLQPRLDANALTSKALSPVSRSAAVWVFPISWIVIVVLLASVVLLVLRVRRRRTLQVARWLEYTENEAKKTAQDSGQN